MSQSYPFNADAKFEHITKTTTEVTDHKNFPPMTNKIETIGKVFRKTYAIVCDGRGQMKFYRLGDKSAKQHEIAISLMDAAEKYMVI